VIGLITVKQVKAFLSGPLAIATKDSSKIIKSMAKVPTIMLMEENIQVNGVMISKQVKVFLLGLQAIDTKGT
jgi:hypothetical protein